MNVSPQERVSGHPSGKPPQQLRRDRLFWGSCLLVFLVAVAVLLILPWVAIAYDQGHRVAIVCTVTDAEGTTSNGTARVPASEPGVYITTSDCGALTLKEGVAESNRDDVAAELAQGGRFSFEIGEATQNLRWLTDPIAITPEVWGYQKVD